MADQVAPSSAQDEVPAPAKVVLFVAGCGSVIPLLAWVSGLGKFSDWGLFVGGPLVVLVIATAAWLDRSGQYPGTRAAITAGAVGGLVGTIGYDLFRLPFQYGLGLQLLAPIDSYGVLLLDASTSSGVTGTAGWLYHFANGIGFGVGYAVLARGRHWGWGIAWALVLETATIVSPFATSYGLIQDSGVQVLPITLAYLAHIPYGYAVGRFAQHADTAHREARELTQRPVLAGMLALVTVVVLWQRPFVSSTPNVVGTNPQRDGDPPRVFLVDQRWNPGWVRIAPGDCFAELLVYEIEDPSGLPVVGGVRKRCGFETGVHRIRIDDEPWSGGFVIVDDQID